MYHNKTHKKIIKCLFFRLSVAVFIILGLLANSFQTAQAQPLARPAQAVTAPDFVDESVMSASGLPTDLARTPDGRLLITLQSGQLVVYSFSGNTVLNAAALNLANDKVICTESERGLQSVVVDPNFANNRRIYVYYTHNGGSGSSSCGGRSDVYNRVVSYVLNDNNTVSNPQIILNYVPTLCGTHNAGDMAFGTDGLLYISVGDGGCKIDNLSQFGSANDNARFMSLLSGKILRLNPDGSIPADNPFVQTPPQGMTSTRCGIAPPNKNGPACQEAFAWGLRNPFRFAFKPGTNQFYINEVGQNEWEEINDGQRAADYGWNVREGNCVVNSTSSCGPPPVGMTNPIYAYSHANGLCSITGGAFPVIGVWPASFNSAYFFGDYCSTSVFWIQPNSSGGFIQQTLVSGASGGVVSLLFDAPTQSLYYSLANGQIRRVRYTGLVNRAPVANANVSPASGPVPLAVTLDGSSSNDPDAGDTITGTWNFGDGSSASGLIATYSYTQAGTFTATLIVTDSRGLASAPWRSTIFASNLPPVVTMASPVEGALTRVGDTVLLSGSAFDPETGDISNILAWEVLLQHVPEGNPQNKHTHPLLTQSGNNLSMVMPPPEDLDASPLSYVEVRLSATDPSGQRQTITRTLVPNRVPITIDSVPSGLKAQVNGIEVVTPRTIIGWEGQILTIATSDTQQNSASNWLRFNNWSNGATLIQSLSVPGSSMTLTAIFTNLPTPTPTPSDTPSPVTITPIPNTATTIPTHTSIPSTATPTPSNTATPTNTPTTLPTLTAVPGISLPIFTDALATLWENWSWGTSANFGNLTPIQSGTRSMAVTYTSGWGGLSLRPPVAINNTSGVYTAIRFWAHGGNATRTVRIYTHPDNSTATSTIYNFSIAPNTWQQIVVPLLALGNPGIIARITLQESSGSSQSVFYIDELVLISTASSVPTATPTTIALTLTATLAPLSTPTRTPTPTPTRAASSNRLVIYEDGLSTGWQNWSWNSTINFANKAPVQAGPRSMAVNYTSGWGGVSLRAPTNINNPSATYSAISFWVHGGSATRSLRIYTHPDDSAATSTVYNFTAPANGWTQIVVPFSALGNPSVISRITVQDRSGSSQSAFYIDQVQLN